MLSEYVSLCHKLRKDSRIVTLAQEAHAPVIIIPEIIQYAHEHNKREGKSANTVIPVIRITINQVRFRKKGANKQRMDTER